MNPIASVIVPAHNEEQVLGRCLDAMLRSADPGEFEIVVVCNGCTDSTADVARRFGPDVRVVETSTAGKIHALNLGDSVAGHFPRLYVDADVRIDTASLREVAKRLGDAGTSAATLRLAVDLTGCSWPVRAYYRIWCGLPYAADGVVGSGVVALSAAGRARFAEFPDVIADDFFVASRFTAAELTRTDGEFVVYPARRAADLVRRKARVFAGLSQLRALDLAPPGGGSSRTWLRVAVRDRRLIEIVPYLAITVTAKLLAARKLRRGRLDVWERDESSRQADPLVPAEHTPGRDR